MKEINIAGQREDARREVPTGRFEDAQQASQKAREARVRRLYAVEGGPLVGLLIEEASSRGQSLQEMACSVDVTIGYINQLRSGMRRPADISHAFAAACARYLRLPTIVVKVIAGNIRMSDFAFPDETEDDVSDQVLMLVQEDRQTGPMRSSDASKLPEMLRWLQRATEIHIENEFEAIRGHRDTAAR